MVTQRSAKPFFAGSNPVGASRASAGIGIQSGLKIRAERHVGSIPTSPTKAKTTLVVVFSLVTRTGENPIFCEAKGVRSQDSRAEARFEHESQGVAQASDEEVRRYLHRELDEAHLLDTPTKRQVSRITADFFRRCRVTRAYGKIVTVKTTEVIMWIALAVVVVLGVLLVGIYNGLVKSRVRVNEAWSDITVQLKRRFDLIPNLVNTVKGYAKHEKGVFEEVTKARSAVMNASESGDVKKTAESDNMFSSTLKSLFAVAEAYPDLKADKNFQQLQADLTDTENKIQASRRFYNGAVRDFNTKVQVFPTNIFAGILGFKRREFYEVDNQEAVEKAPEVKL